MAEGPDHDRFATQYKDAAYAIFKREWNKKIISFEYFITGAAQQHSAASHALLKRSDTRISKPQHSPVKVTL